MGSTRPSHHVEVTTLREGKAIYPIHIIQILRKLFPNKYEIDFSWALCAWFPFLGLFPIQNGAARCCAMGKYTVESSPLITLDIYYKQLTVDLHLVPRLKCMEFCLDSENMSSCHCVCSYHVFHITSLCSDCNSVLLRISPASISALRLVHM
jgi:hypothetical protein